jgi:hypothetical protein
LRRRISAVLHIPKERTCNNRNHDCKEKPKRRGGHLVDCNIPRGGHHRQKLIQSQNQTNQPANKDEEAWNQTIASALCVSPVLFSNNQSLIVESRSLTTAIERRQKNGIAAIVLPQAWNLSGEEPAHTKSASSSWVLHFFTILVFSPIQLFVAGLGQW